MCVRVGGPLFADFLTAFPPSAHPQGVLSVFCTRAVVKLLLLLRFLCAARRSGMRSQLPPVPTPLFCCTFSAAKRVLTAERAFVTTGVPTPFLYFFAAFSLQYRFNRFLATPLVSM